jgi:AcrR family transcriptional regulator
VVHGRAGICLHFSTDWRGHSPRAREGAGAVRDGFGWVRSDVDDVHIVNISHHVFAVNMPYHHGHLRAALLDAALAAGRADGPDAITLRAATRAAGVSANAAYRHFADRADLLRAVAQTCMERLAELIEIRLAELAPGTDPAGAAAARLRAAGHAYVEFALSEPGWFKTAFAASPAPSDEPAEPLGQQNPYAILNDTLDLMVTDGALPPDHRRGAEFAAWAAVHGIATLFIDGPLRNLPAPARDPIVTKVIDVVLAGL